MTSFSYKCPHCGATTEVTEEFAGKSGPCFHCQKTINIPQAAPSTWTPEDVFTARRGQRSLNVLKLLTVAGAIVLIAFGAFAGFFWVLLPALNIDVESGRQREVQDKLKRIATALTQYHADYGSYPPPYTVDGKGKRMHSWRALLIPYLDDDKLMGDYSFEHAWDSPENMVFHARSFEPFQLPGGAPSSRLNHTGFMVIVGTDTLFPGGGRRITRTSAADESQTLLVVEVADSGVHWLEPRDLDRGTMTFQVNGSADGEISDERTAGGWVVRESGEVSFLADDTPADDVESWATRNPNDDP